MISKNTICILFISLVLASAIGCLADDPEGPSALNVAVPGEDLPEGFTLLAALPEMDSRVNMTDYIVHLLESINGASPQVLMMPR